MAWEAYETYLISASRWHATIRNGTAVQHCHSVRRVGAYPWEDGWHRTASAAYACAERAAKQLNRGEQ